MDQMSSMALYAYDLDQVSGALESFDLYCEDIGLESVNSEVNAQTEDINRKIPAIMAEYNRAMRHDDFEGAKKALDTIEEYLDQAMEDAKSITPDKHKNLKKVVKIAVLAAAIIISFKSLPMAAKATATLGKIIPKLASDKIRPIVRAVIGGTLVYGSSFVSSSIIYNKLLEVIVGGRKKTFEKTHGQDPNADNANYRGLINGLSEMKTQLASLRTELDKVSHGLITNPYSGNKAASESEMIDFEGYMDAYESAMESLKSDIGDISSDANARLTDKIADMQKCLANEDWDGAHKAIDMMGDILDDAIADMRSMKANPEPEKYKKVLKTVGSIVGVSLGIMALPAAGYGAANLIFSGAKPVLKAVGAAALIGGGAAAYSGSLIRLANMTADAVIDSQYGMKKEDFIEKYGDSANAWNTQFRSTFNMFNVCKKQLAEMHKNVDKIKNGEDENSFKAK